MAFLVDLRESERRPAWSAFFSLLGITAAHTLLETARDALFLAKLPASRLPWMYLAIAGIGLLLARAAKRGEGGKKKSRSSVSLSLAIAAGVNATFWLLRGVQRTELLYALYVWGGIFASWVIVQFWLLLGAIFNVGQAKRLFGFIGAGSVLGAVLGAAFARALAHTIEAPHLLLVAALVLLLTAAGPALLLGGPPPEEPERSEKRASSPAKSSSLGADLALVRQEPYLARILALILLSTVALTMVDYLFKASAAEHIEKAKLAEFFATVYVALNGIALVVQVAGVGWMLRILGVHRALLVMPVLMILGAGSVLATGTLAAALLMKGADGALRHSLHRTSTELLYLPISDSVRARIKPFIDLVGQRGGQALASLVILAFGALLLPDKVLAALVVVLGAAWVYAAATMRRHYLDVFRVTLREGRIDPEGDVPELDLGALEALFAALNSRKDAEVLAALDLLAAQARRRLIPALILYHPSKPIVLRALELLVEEGRDDFVPVAERLLSHGDAEVRAAALRAISAVAADESLLVPRMQHECLSVRATAVVALVAKGWLEGEQAREALDAIKDDPSSEVRVALARAIAQQPSPHFETTLLDLATTKDTDVLAEVATAMGKVKITSFLPHLLRFLGLREVAVASGDALAELGEPALARLTEALADRSLPAEIRWNIPRALGNFPAEQAVPILTDLLLQAPEGIVRYRSLRGLCHLRLEHPRAAIDEDALRRAVEASLIAAYVNLDARIALERGGKENEGRTTSAHRLLITLLRDKEENAKSRLFRLLGLLYPAEKFERIQRGLASKNKKTRASSRELCENVIAQKLRHPVLNLVDDLADAERLDRAAPFYAKKGGDYVSVLQKLGARGGELASLAAYHAAEIGVSLEARAAAGEEQESALVIGLRALEGRAVYA